LLQNKVLYMLLEAGRIRTTRI